jgi:multiple sugar transport system ATP-binding protein
VVKDTYKDSLVKMDVDVAELLGAETNIHATVGDTIIVAKVNARTDINIGDKIELAFDMNKVHFFDVETELRIDLVKASKIEDGEIYE